MKIKGTIKMFWNFSIWLISILTLLLSLLFIFVYQLTGILMFIAGLMIFPPFWKLINKRISFKTPVFIKIVLFVTLFIFSVEKLPPPTKTADVQVRDQSTTPSPATQVKATKQEPVKNTANIPPTSSKEEGFDQKRYEDTAKAYCNERKGVARLYPVLKLEDGTGGKAELKPVTSKQGRTLTLEDCLGVMIALEFTNKMEHAQDIAEGKFWQGMDFFEIGYSLGTPDDRTTKTESGFLGVPNETEMLTYRNGSQVLYLYLENKLLTKWVEDY